MRREAEVKHNCRWKKYPNGKVHVTVFSRNIYTQDGFELWNDEYKETREPRQYRLDEPRDDNMRRAKGKIFDIALSNDWYYMLTLTLDKDKIDRYDPKAVTRPFCKWLNNMVNRKGLQYLIVPELHEDGAIHFHGLMNDVLDLVDSGTVKVPDYEKPIKCSTAVKYGYDLDSSDVRTVYNVKNYKLGYSTAVRIDNNVEAVSKYMTKYTCKNFQKIFGQSFFAGGAINRELPADTCDLNFISVDAETYFLPEGLGAVKYMLVDEAVFEVLKKEWSLYEP